MENGVTRNIQGKSNGEKKYNCDFFVSIIPRPDKIIGAIPTFIWRKELGAIASRDRESQHSLLKSARWNSKTVTIKCLKNSIVFHWKGCLVNPWLKVAFWPLVL